MKIGIIGSGIVSQTLAAGFVKLGNEVMISSRYPEQDKVKIALEKIGKLASAGTFEEAAKFGDIVVLSTAWSGTQNAIEMAGADNLAGKIVIDTTNPLDFSYSPPRLAIGHTNSAGEMVQKWLPKSHVVKAFNMVGNAHMFKPEFSEGNPDIFICGNDENAKKSVTDILHEFGWTNVIDMGSIESSRLLEPMAMVWITYGYRMNLGVDSLSVDCVHSEYPDLVVPLDNYPVERQVYALEVNQYCGGKQSGNAVSYLFLVYVVF
jgi:predicted dinucleotide-binding enzyme